MKIDSVISATNTIICKNIDKFDASERGLLSQNILAQTRTFVESIAVKIFSQGADIDYNHDNIRNSLAFVKSLNGNYRFLCEFHNLLQKSVSHYTLDENNSERLMLKYYEYLLKIKVFLKDSYGMEVLGNINNFPLNTDPKLMEYYGKIVAKIKTSELDSSRSSYSDRYYIQKIKPFFVNQKIFYEITFTVANDKASKFDRVIAFTKLDISHNYAVKLSVRYDYIEIMGKNMPIQIIDGWFVSIRPCEFDNFTKIFGKHQRTNTNSAEYTELMAFLTDTGMNLVEFIDSPDEYFLAVKSQITQKTKVLHFFDILEKCRILSKNDSQGANVIKYLLYGLNNKIIKHQYENEVCEKLSGLYLSYGCIPFDQMPFNTSLKNHNPRFSDLLDCINPEGREPEILARLIKNNTETKGMLFTPCDEISEFDNIEELMQRYNNALYYKHAHRKLDIYNNHVYIQGYAADSAGIIKRLKDLSSSGIDNYSNSVDFWLKSTTHGIDCVDKKSALKLMFEYSHVALIYGSAGTGKSTLINHISNFFNDKKKIYLANTNPAVDNLRRKVKAADCTFKTIAKFLSAKNDDTVCDLLFIDECSTVSNMDMKNIFEKANFRLLVLVGDVFQIESIIFGNWFKIARSFISEKSVFELEKPYRTTNPTLIDVWNKVRILDNAILEPLLKAGISKTLDQTIFDHSEEDQIILCLNYDGLYGINNINRFLQSSNVNRPVQWGINIYKVNDPILFNESERFTPLIYNNLKGRIDAIESSKDQIQFDIEIDKVINELDAEYYNFNLIGTSVRGSSIIRFSVDKYKSTDDDDDLSSDTIVPFQVAYAVSIHKSQGLEYNSVKVIITNEVEELITLNIFYTAITRAKEKLEIYWTPETEHQIINSFELKNNGKDVALLSKMFNLK